LNNNVAHDYVFNVTLSYLTKHIKYVISWFFSYKDLIQYNKITSYDEKKSSITSYDNHVIKPMYIIIDVYKIT